MIIFYQLYRTDKYGRGGDVALYVKSGISVTVLKTVTTPHSLESIAPKINLSCDIAIIIVGAYRPPSDIFRATDNLADELAQCFNSEILVLGDFNLNWFTND